jgi:signal transduction histidine kinase
LHDLRGAVNNIGLAVEAVVRLPLDPAEREERLGLLRESVERLAALLEAFARREGAS